MNLAAVSAVSAILRPDFTFPGWISRAVQTEQGQKLLVLVASDTLLDRHNTRMTEQAIGMMVDAARAGLMVCPGHDFHFGWSETTDAAAVEFEVPDQHGKVVKGTAFVTVFPVPSESEYPEAHHHLSRLWDQVQEGKATHQSSIGGFVPVNDPAAVTEVRLADGKRSHYDINIIRLNHLAITRGGEASNMRTGFVGAVERGNDGFATSIVRSIFGDAAVVPTAASSLPAVTLSDGAMAVLRRGGRLAEVSECSLVSLLSVGAEPTREPVPGVQPMPGVLRNWRAKQGAGNEPSPAPETAPASAPVPPTAAPAQTARTAPAVPVAPAAPAAPTAPAAGQPVARSSDAHADRFMTALEEVLGANAPVDDQFMRAATALASLPCDNLDQFKRLAAIQMVLHTRLLTAEAIPMQERLLALSVPMGVLDDGIKGILSKLETRTIDATETAATEVADVLLKRMAALEAELQRIKGTPHQPQALGSGSPSTPETQLARGGQDPFSGTLAAGMREWRGRGGA